MLRYLIPLGLFLVLVVFLAIGLTRDPREIPSALVNKPAPTSTRSSLTANQQGCADVSPAAAKSA
jgi:cytochrome c biogenesis protein CcmG/thiol:disulfide interchange protein DsbE